MSSTNSFFQIIRRVIITDAMLMVEPTVPENDHEEWDEFTAYVATDRRIVTAPGVHKIYEALLPNTGKNPVDNPLNEDGLPYWAAVGPTNRWRMLDRSAGTLTTAITSMEYVIAPGRVSTLVLRRMKNVINVRVRMNNVSAGQFFDETYVLPEARPPRTMYDYWFEERRRRSYLVVNDLPLVADAEITITINGGVGQEISVGTCALGRKRVVGGVQRGAESRLIDFSTKTDNGYGVIDFVKGEYTNAAALVVEIEGGAAEVDAVMDVLAEYLATPAIYLGIGDLYGSFIVEGVYTDARTVVPYAKVSYLSINLEGAT